MSIFANDGEHMVLVSQRKLISSLTEKATLKEVAVGTIKVLMSEFSDLDDLEALRKCFNSELYKYRRANAGGEIEASVATLYPQCANPFHQ